MPIQLKCLSHTPLRGKNDPGAEVVAEVNAITAQARAEVEAFDPELIVVFAPDHFNGLFYDLMPPFVLATAATSIGDFGTLPGPLSIPRELANDMARHLLDSDVDIALSHRFQVDHGCTQSLEELTGSLTRYPVIPIIINCAAPPLVPFRRIRQLGQAVGTFLARLNQRVLILGTGGLSHEPPIPMLETASAHVAEFLIAGRNPSPEARAIREARTVAAGQAFGTPASQQRPLNPAWDLAFMQLLKEGRLHDVDSFTNEDVSLQGGRSAHEIRTWVAAFAALQAACTRYVARQDYYRPINEWIAGYGVMSADGQA